MPAATNNTVALIPARAGSKAIPRKNVKEFLGKPLIYWVCLAAEQCAHVSQVYVATDDSEIAEVVASFNLSKVQAIERAPETATDTASTESVMLDFSERIQFDHLLLLQATSPLTRSTDLNEAFAAYCWGASYDSVLSVVRQKRFVWTPDGSGRVLPWNYDPRVRPRRQDFEGFWVENGALYLTSRKQLLASKCRLGSSVGHIEMALETLMELDDQSDWSHLESLVRSSAELWARFSGGPIPFRGSQSIRLVASDVDGVLTDAGMYYGERGDELKKFNTRDGKGFELLRNLGVLTCLITSEQTEIVERRAGKLCISEVHQGVNDKRAVMAEILQRRGLDWGEVAYIGDDLGDLSLIRSVGFSAAPADARPEVLEAVDIVLGAKGGEGALRELVDRLISANRLASSPPL